MNAVTIEELQRATNHYVRAAMESPLIVTDGGKPVVLLKRFQQAGKSGRPLPKREAWIASLPETADSAQTVSDDRDRG
ncbi:MAG: hypothetical protein EXS31_11445 [Pedosphaera sp.]|nr:hypothetical protein [Pedosphaera sp.]